jgi:hypothetical protein
VHKWTERARLRDMDLDRLLQRDQERALARMLRRKVAFALRQQDLVLEALLSMSPDELRPADIPRWLESAFRLESEGRGIVPIEKRQLEITGPGGGPIEEVVFDLDQPILTHAERRAALDAGRRSIEGVGADVGVREDGGDRATGPTP